jgi:hypothetical protein
LKESGSILKEEEVDISLQKRVKTTDTITLAADVVSLYEYTVGLVTDFPKDVLSRSSKLKEIKKASAGQAAENRKTDQSTEWKELFNSKAKEVIHQRIFNAEVMNLLKDQDKKIENLIKITDVDRNTIKQISAELDDAKVEIARLVSVFSNYKQQDLQHSLAGAASYEGQSSADECLPGSQETCTDEIASPASERGSLNTSPEMTITIQGDGGVPKEAKPETEVDIVLADDKDDSFTPVSKEKKTMNKMGQVKSAGMPHYGQHMVTRVVEANGVDFTTYLHKKGKPKSQPLEQYRRQQHRQWQEQAQQDQYRRTGQDDRQRTVHLSSRLRGVKQERGIPVYLRSIAVDEETDEEVIRMVKEHASSHGVRIMSQTVIRNRRYTDMVGCKITIPLSQEPLHPPSPT